METGTLELFQHLARVGQALASAPRLRMLNLLFQGEKTVDRLAQLSGESVPNTSAHLKVLRAACLVRTRKQGRQVYCTLAGDAVARLWLALDEAGRQLMPDVREVIGTYLSDPQSLLPLTPAELQREVSAGNVTLIDLRPPDEFAAGRIARARSIPHEELRARLRELPKRRRIAAYCRGPYCVSAVEAVAKLRELGFKAYRVPFGIVEWKSEGLPVETGSPSTVE